LVEQPSTVKIDRRSISEVQPDDLRRFTRCHFFAGIAGWELALQLAGWCDDDPVWTGSCPCQPFSVAGDQKSASDERHLWPEFFRLIKECRPPIVFGEQVGGKLGLLWLSGVRADMEALGYAFGGANLCAAGIGAPHIRQRLFWVGHTIGIGSSKSVTKKVAPYSTSSPFTRACVIECANGKKRRIEPGLEPLANGVPKRMVQIKSYGNSIVPQLAAVFIRSCVEAINESQRSKP